MHLRYKYRIYPTQQQAIALSQLFGSVRVVWNDALSKCQQDYQEGSKKLSNGELQKLFITRAKKTKPIEWLTGVSAIPLQQSLNDLNVAYQSFFKSSQGERKGKAIRPPRFKSRKTKQSARFTKGGFRVHQHKVYLAKIGKIKVKWSRKLPSKPSSVTVIKDNAHRYFLSFVVEVMVNKLPSIDKSVGIDLGISDLGWRSFRTMLEAKSIMSGRDLRVIDRWTPTSQTCSCCGFKGGKKELSVREWTCLNCNAVHDRDINAAVNIKVAGGLSETQNGRGGRRKTTKAVAVAHEASTRQEFTQLSLFG